jgi:hypothetical protein
MSTTALLLEHAIRNHLILDGSYYEEPAGDDVSHIGFVVITPSQSGYTIPRGYFSIGSSDSFWDFPVVSNNYRSLRKLINDLGPRYSGYMRAFNASIPAGIDTEWLNSFEDVSRPIDISFLQIMAPKPIMRSSLSDAEVRALFVATDAEFNSPRARTTDGGISVRYPENWDLPDDVISERIVAGNEQAFKSIENYFNTTLSRRFQYLLQSNQDSYLSNIVNAPELLRQFVARYNPIDGNRYISNDDSKQYVIETIRHAFANLFYAMEVLRSDTILVQVSEDMIDAIARGLFRADEWDNDNSQILRRYQERRDTR